jgi:tRNA(adenine34) deaminase
MKKTIDINSSSDEFFMRAALREANKALICDDVPIGAVIVKDGKIIAKSYNKIEKRSDSISHAEVNVIQSAMKKSNYKHLLDSTIYVTLEPCTMCAGAIVLARMKRLVFGAYDTKAGAVRSLFSICDDKRLNHRLEVTGGVLAEESSALLKSFFRKLRVNNK